jgi:hydroxyacylglutathione hydrolase
MIRDGISADEVEPYLHAWAWLADAAQLLSRTPEVLTAELADTMLRSGAAVLRDGRLHAAAEHTPVAVGSLSVPFPRAWPAAARARAQAAEPQ